METFTSKNIKSISVQTIMLKILHKVSSWTLVGKLLNVDVIYTVSCSVSRMLKRKFNIHLPPAQVVSLYLIVALFLLLSFRALLKSWFVAVLVIIFFSSFLLFLPKKEESELQKLKEMQMVEVFRLLSSSFSSGKTLMQSFDVVGKRLEAPLGPLFSKAAFTLSIGEESSKVLTQLVNCVDCEGVELLSAALAIAEKTGAPLSEIFKRAAESVIEKQSLDRALSIKTAQAQISAKIVGTLPLILVIFLTLLSQDFRDGLQSFTGIVSLTIATLLTVFAVLIIKKILEGARR